MEWAGERITLTSGALLFTVEMDNAMVSGVEEELRGHFYEYFTKVPHYSYIVHYSHAMVSKWEDWESGQMGGVEWVGRALRFKSSDWDFESPCEPLTEAQPCRGKNLFEHDDEVDL